MLIKARVFEHYSNYNFKIPLDGGERLYIKNGQKIGAGENLFSKSENGIKESYFLVNDLNCKIAECIKYVSCIDGSYVEEGEVLAQKMVKNGLTVKQIVATVSGIVDLSRISKGFIDILSEEQENLVKSNFSGTVNEVLPGSNISINSPASALDLAATTIFDNKIFGNILFFNKENAVLSDIPNIDLKGKIVWFGSYLSMNLILKIFQRGAKAVLTYSMEYDDFKDIGLPIGVIEGFGRIHCDSKFSSELYKIDESFVVLDGSEDQLFVAKKEQREKQDTGFFVKELLGAKVISRHSSHYGYIGIISQINDLNYVTVDFGNAGKSIVDIGSLDFIVM
ncbi:MAG: hypothetical protein PHP08_01075 [Candidatus Dojkabacteria bacterium]|nr:hypothetical protein [Candidatus Dojkabacteria bacterium]